MVRVKKPILIDGRGHLVGRLASVIAKQLLSGRSVVVVRCEDLQLSGHFFRNKIKFLAYLRKRCNVNPARGPFHFRAPSRMLWKAVRGMVPHKTKRGQDALHRLKVYEGIPQPYDRQKRLVVPIALRKLCLRPDRKYCTIDRVAHEVGWKYRDVVSNLEAKRKIKSRLAYLHKKKLKKITWKARSTVADKIKSQNEVLKEYGFLTSEFEQKYSKPVLNAVPPKPTKRQRKELALVAKAARKAARLEAKAAAKAAGKPVRKAVKKKKTTAKKEPAKAKA
ncbi:large ribosomal subunit protein uL13 [Anopheles ziemanni]|uniref:large ribosomal subunit protein uL13 n=1 Tax=Anopheles coustani TaxID=139045 RepID=UPI002657F23A|nr:large ribosomal subunit protein uL13 [Anopheles coustani]XP_058168073.1 large ribosomal subunit protein uL13 [Anopheles ziemanni]